MISTHWLEKRKPHWQRLESLLELVGVGGVSALPHRELQELGLLYRQTAADLSAVREDPASRNLAAYLNQLMGRAHNIIYAGKAASPGGVYHFYTRLYPRIFRQTLAYTLTAFALFLAAALAGVVLCLHDSSFPQYLLGAHMTDTIERREMWTHSIVGIKPLASSAIMTNNLAVSFAAFAFGVTAGLGTIYMMLFNGLLMGVIGTACWQSGLSVPLWSFVAPHGVLELPAIFIAGGGGLLLARGLLFPGLLPRKDSLRIAGGLGVRLMLGAVPLLIVAGVIEGFVSPSSLPVSLKFMLAGALGTMLVLYLVWGGRGDL
ncbi:MAG: stage II sporulation protein M [Acidobacteria bacterium]|nr:stage II sporulation protein M [Acidobacteriota bacterium]